MGSSSHEKGFGASYLWQRTMNAGAHYVWPSDGASALEQNSGAQWSRNPTKEEKNNNQTEKKQCIEFSRPLLLKQGNVTYWSMTAGW